MTCLFSVLSAQVTLSPRAVFANEQELCHLCHLGRWAWRGGQGGAPSSLLFSLQPALSGSPGFICWSRGFMELGVTGSRAELVDSLKEYSAHRGNPPLLLFPEEAATNGRAGLLRFRCGSGNFHSRGEGILTAGGRELSQQGGWEWLWCIVTRWLEVAPGSFTAEFLPSSSWPFSILDEVQPIALQVRRPLVAVVSGGHRDRLWGGYSFFFCSCFGACDVAWPRVLAPWNQLLRANTVPSAFPGNLASQSDRCLVAQQAVTVPLAPVASAVCFPLGEFPAVEDQLQSVLVPKVTQAGAAAPGTDTGHGARAAPHKG